VPGTIEVYRNRERVARAAAERFVAIARASVAERGRFAVALSGGNTPRDLLACLSGAPYGDRVPWDATHVFWSDERAVPPSHPDSNYGLARQVLLDHVPIGAAQIHRIETERPPEDAAARYTRVLADVVGADGLDLLVVGMGADGHVASLFPGNAALLADRRGAVACFVSQLQAWRVTLSLPEVNHARSVLVLVTDAAKGPALAEVRAGASTLPAARVAPGTGNLAWLLDRPTADAMRASAARAATGDTGGSTGEVEAMKQQAAEAAAGLVVSDMVLGLGTGSTARYVVEAVGRRLRDGTLKAVAAVPTSEATAALARVEGVPLVDLDARPRLDLTIDGADEISPALDLVKGRGGALVREKIVATASDRLVIVADAAKLVDRLGTRTPLPVAVVPYGWASHIRSIHDLGAAVRLRVGNGGDPIVTDDGLYTLDCTFADGIPDPVALDAAILARPGVVDSGLFLGMADSAYVADAQGVIVFRR
jgi:ribose 5-phosphate isomerase A